MPNEKCKVHGVILKTGKVPVHYGLPVMDKELFEVRRMLFPNARTYVGGGCMVGAMGNRSEVLFCEECREVETAWYAANRNSRQKIGDMKT